MISFSGYKTILILWAPYTNFCQLVGYHHGYLVIKRCNWKNYIIDGFSGKIIEITYKSSKKRENCPVAMLRWYLHRAMWGWPSPTGPGAVGADGDRQFVPGGLGAAAPHGRKHLRPRRMCHSAKSRRKCGGFFHGKISELNSGVLMFEHHFQVPVTNDIPNSWVMFN